MNAATTVAVDLAPLAQMLLVGAMIAALALGWIWLRRRGQGAGSWTQKLTVLTLVLTFDLVVFGAFTRLSDSGLGCPDWPGCYGHASPMGAKAHIQAAESAMPSGPVTHASSARAATSFAGAATLGVRSATAHSRTATPRPP